MTKPTQDKETLREAVARAIDACDPDRIDHALCLRQADAAIATVFERLRTPSEGILRAGYFAEDLYPKHQCDNQKELHRCVSEPRWRAVLDAFQQENSDAANN